MGANYPKCCCGGGGIDGQQIDIEEKEKTKPKIHDNKLHKKEYKKYIKLVTELDNKRDGKTVNIRDYNQHEAYYGIVCFLLYHAAQDTNRRMTSFSSLSDDTTNKNKFLSNNDPFNDITAKWDDHSDMERDAVSKEVFALLTQFEHNFVNKKDNKNLWNDSFRLLNKDDVDIWAKQWIKLNEFEQKVYLLKFFELAAKHIKSIPHPFGMGEIDIASLDNMDNDGISFLNNQINEQFLGNISGRINDII